MMRLIEAELLRMAMSGNLAISLNLNQASSRRVAGSVPVRAEAGRAPIMIAIQVRGRIKLYGKNYSEKQQNKNFNFQVADFARYVDYVCYDWHRNFATAFKF